MKKPEDSPLPCSYGEDACDWLEEVKKLRQQISELSGLVVTDVLTGLYNFRHFKNVLQAEMDRSKRSGIPTSLVMVDLDHFKKINQTMGHEVGNWALKQVANILRNEVRTTDIVCRYGRKEFAMIFPETHLNLAVKVADRIRETIAFTPVEYEGGELHITTSMGASVYMKTSILVMDAFIDSVEKFLYEAKQSGRNCICHIDFTDLRRTTEISADERILLYGGDD
jgi:diguanylate cyclase (GGDEF)-like protein